MEITTNKFVLLFALMLGVLDATSDVHSKNLRLNAGGQTVITVQKNVQTELVLKMDIRNHGPDNIPQANGGQKNFVFRAQVNEESQNYDVQAFQNAQSNDDAIGLNKNSEKTVVLKTQVKILEADCNKNLVLCACTKAAKNVVFDNNNAPQQVIAYSDPNNDNDIICIPIRCSDSDVTGDPHFVVYGTNPDALPVCFDIDGHPGAHFYLLNDTQAGWSLSATTYDDKYFHFIVFATKKGYVTVDTRGVPSTGLNWKSSGQAKVRDIELEHDLNLKKLMIRSGLRDRTVEVAVRLMRHSGSVRHLDIQIERHPILDENVGGILGYSKRNYVNSQNPVQEIPLGAVKIQDRYFGAKLAKRGDTTCWLVSPQVALYPFKAEHFIEYDDNEEMSMNIV